MNNRHRATSILSSQVTSTVTVSLVLLMLGIVALTGVAARNISREITGGMTLAVVLADNASHTEATDIGAALRTAPYSAEVTFVSADEVLARWNIMMPSDSTPPDMNPFLPEWNVVLNPAWVHPDSLTAIAATLSTMPGVEEVSTPYDIAAPLYRSFHTTEIVLSIVALFLAVISFVLIFNTVKLAIHSRRFTINTMTLVGAKPGYIRRPFIAGAACSGLIAATCAVIILGAALWYATLHWPETAALISTEEALITFAVLIAAGIAICAIAAYAATGKYLRADFDDIVN
ncbi:MAG: permease-like cell division protein FtsX [Muribaculaceae bacterium]|nr:permease-like cell division protein FtsX [Muribaculaceae bacterium]